MIQCRIIGIVDDEVSVNPVSYTHLDVYKRQEKAYDLKEMHRVVNSLPKEYRVPFACLLYTSLYLYILRLLQEQQRLL